MNIQQTQKKNTFIENSAKMAKAFIQSDTAIWLNEYRQSNIELLETSVFPHKRVEHFKYNRLSAFDECNYDKYVSSSASQINIDDYVIDGLKTDGFVAKVVFIDGVFQVEKSDFNSHKITAFADTDQRQQALIVKSLTDAKVTHNPFLILNACLTNNGIFIEIDESSPKSIIEVINIVTDEKDNDTIANQIVIDIAARTSATVITRTISAQRSDNINVVAGKLSTNRIVVNVGDNATFNHYHLPLEDTYSIHFGSVCYNLNSHTTLNAFHAITGGNVKKVDVDVNHNGQYALAKLNGLYVATDNEQVDYHTTVTHLLPNGKTEENFRGIVNGRGEAVFNGRIHIYQDAQKTLAKLSNKNLLLSDDAILHTKPELEIYADDVICAHGATVSRLQDSALSYMCARGISKPEATLLLSFAFFDELLRELELTVISDYIRPILFESFK